MRVFGGRHARWWLAGALVVLLTVLGGVGANTWSLFKQPEVRVAFNQFPPYLDKGPDGTPIGFAAEVVAKAAKNAGIAIRWVEIQGAADDAFSQGIADMYPLMTITPQRESQFYMSAPWWENQFALISTTGREIPDSTAAKGKRIAARPGVITDLSKRLFPGAQFVDMRTMTQMERALCDREIDGFFSDTRLLQAQLLRRTAACAGQALRGVSVPGSRLFLGTASTKAASAANDRIFREIAKLALDGTLTRAASGWGISRHTTRRV